MLFHNKEREYDFSRYSDKLSIANPSGIPVIVTVSAAISELGEIELAGQDDFAGNGNPAIYLALTDDRGNEQPVSADGNAAIQVELGSGIYSFGLTGSCNPEAQWQEVSVHPKVTITWHVEPALAGMEEAETEPGESPEEPGKELEPKEEQNESAGGEPEESPDQEPESGKSPEEESEPEPGNASEEEPGTESAEEPEPIEEQKKPAGGEPATEPEKSTEESPVGEPAPVESPVPETESAGLPE